MNHAPGNLFVVAAPSGTGKTTLVHALIEAVPGITVSISHTTRARRSTEMNGVNYYFVDVPEFQRMVKHNEFLEHATVFNHLYGTSKKWVEETLANGTDVILEIDWQGAQQIQHLFPTCISIFILPPSLEALSDRLLHRNQDSSDMIRQRLADVREATTHIKDFTYVVMNDDFSHALNDLKIIVESGRLLQARQSKIFAPLLEGLTHMGDII